MKKLFGVTTAMITPFDDKGRVDADALTALTDFLIQRGVNCLYPCGTTGEMFMLSQAERECAAETVVKAAKGRVNVFIHAGAMCQEETIALARHAQKIGADGVGVVTPVFFGAEQREMEAYYKNVAGALDPDFPVYLYNIPQCAANDLLPDTAKRVKDACPNVIGIKYSFPDMLRTNEYINVAEGFSVLQGSDRLFLPALAMGCDGTVSGVSSVYPEPFVRVYEAYQAGDIASARAWQKIATTFVETLHCGANMAYFKTGLAHRGINAGHMRVPHLDLTPDKAQALEEALTQAEKTLK